MDKVLAKQVADAYGIPVTKFLVFGRNELEQSPAECLRQIIKTLQFPLFVKPTHLGSSIGISRAADETALRNGLEVATHYDDKILVEEGVQNLVEVTLPIMGNDQLTPALLERPLTKPEDFFDFEAKYLQGGGKSKGGAKGGKEHEGGTGLQ